MHTLNAFCKYILAAVAALASVGTAQAQVTVLHAFTGGRDGWEPRAGLIGDSAGNLYGTTQMGGSRCWEGEGCGIVFKLAQKGTETVLYRFTSDKDGGIFPSGVIEDKAGNLYGTTAEGGTGGAPGIVFRLAPDGNETVLYAFHGHNDGSLPTGGVISDSAGNLYGTTQMGGGSGCYADEGCGTVFELAPDGTETVLYSFAGGNDGEYPYAGVIEDKARNLYGMTPNGGADGFGIVFKLSPHGKETVLHTFTGGSDGGYPFAGLIEDDAGNLYGTTETGGNGCDCGVVFKLTPGGTETVLYAFAGGSDGAYPEAGLIRDRAGNLYGTTINGGFTGCNKGRGCGTVFKLAPDGTEVVLYAFDDRKRGGFPQASLMEDKTGNLYGTTLSGGLKRDCYGRGCGTVFRLTK
jgi:uncharacterized repeat protein (TIGR03803 family)